MRNINLARQSHTGQDLNLENPKGRMTPFGFFQWHEERPEEVEWDHMELTPADREAGWKESPAWLLASR